MTKPSNIEMIEDKTGKKWEEWVKLLDSFNARELKHKDITKKLHEITDVDGWHIQSIVVAYEQHIGRREPGQRADGTYETSVSKTLDGSMDEALDAWIDLIGDRDEINSVKLADEPSVSRTEKWRNWRVKLEDGTNVVVGINQKTPDKAGLGLAHQKLSSKSKVEEWNSFWKAEFAKLD
jgi:hypothetical protein